MKNLISKFILFMTSFVIMISVLLNASYFILNNLPNKNRLFSTLISRWFQQPVQIKQTDVEGFTILPEIEFHDITIGHIQLPAVHLSLNLWRSLLEGRWVADQVVVDHLRLRIWQDQKNQLNFLGISANPLPLQKNDTVFKNILSGLLSQPEIMFSHAQITVTRANGTTLNFPDMDAVFKNHHNRHVAVAFAALGRSSLKIIANIYTGFTQNIMAHVNVFLQANEMPLSPWLPFLSDLSGFNASTHLSGVMNVKMWGKYANDHWQTVQAQWSLANITEDALKINALRAFTTASHDLANHAWIANTRLIVDDMKWNQLPLQLNMQLTSQLCLTKKPMLSISGSGSVNGNEIDSLRVNISNLSHPTAVLNAHIKTDISRALAMLHENTLKAQGSLTGTIHLQLPSLRGGMHLSSQKVVLPELHLPLKQLSVFVRFRDPALHVVLGEINAFDQAWKNVTLEIKSIKQGLSIDLHSDAIKGDIFYPIQSVEPLRVHLNKLNVNMHHHEKQKDAMNPAQLPPLNITIDQLMINYRLKGRAHLVTTPIANGLMIRTIALDSPLLQFDATGNWIYRNARAATTLVGHLRGDDLGMLLSQNHWSSRIKGGQFSSDFSLTWSGSPEQFSIKHTDGKIDLSIKKGCIQHLGSETESNLMLGQLLNLFTLDSISHLLTFDFSSWTKNGFPFDTIESQCELAQGTLFTPRFEMNGPLANVNLTGKIGLMNGTNDLRMFVYPKVSSSLPTLIGFAGGPVIGAAAWLANKLVSPTVSQMMAMNYEVKGTWDKPVIKRVG